MASGGEQKTSESDSALMHILRPMIHWAPILALTFVVLYRPIVSGLVAEIAPLSVFSCLLLVALFFWLCEGVLREHLTWRGGWGTCVAFAFLLWMAVSASEGHHLLASVRVWALFASYALTGFLVLHVGKSRQRRAFLLSCLFASGAALAAYAVFHRAFYIPAMRSWIEQDPEYFRSVFEVSDRMFDDLLTRVRGGRAYGNFITPNQLASFLLLVFFPLGGLAFGLWRSRDDRAPGFGWRRVAIVVGAGMLGMALALTGSKGGMVGFVIGTGIILIGPAWDWATRNRRKIIGIGAALVVLFVLGQLIGIVPGWKRFRASLGVRVDYWSVSAEMIGDHPVVGVGPGCWEEHYTLRKEPEYEETRLSHNAYLQIWSETGTVGFALFLLAIAVPFWQAFRRPPDDSVPSPEKEDSAETVYPRLGWGLICMALVADYLFVGTFRAPQSGAPQLLRAIPWIPYLVIGGVWMGAFSALFPLLRSGTGRRYLRWGIGAGLVAFLVHSTAEFTLRIPALGSTVVALGGLLIADGVSHRRFPVLRDSVAKTALVVVFVLTFGWATWLMPRCLDYSLKKDQIFAKRGESEGEAAATEKIREFGELYGEALASIPWDDECWQELARHKFALSQYSGVPGPGREQKAANLIEARNAIRRAIELNRLKSEHYRVAGEVYMALGEEEQAVEMLRQSAELHPSIPRSWMTFARTAEGVEGLTERVCRAYRRAKKLNVRKTGGGGMVVQGQYHKRNLLPEKQARLVDRKVQECESRGEAETDDGG